MTSRELELQLIAIGAEVDAARRAYEDALRRYAIAERLWILSLPDTDPTRATWMELPEGKEYLASLEVNR